MTEIHLPLNVDELIYLREKAKERKNWALTDRIREYLDTRLVFVFDTVGGGQEVYHMAREKFKNKPEGKTDRRHMEDLIKKDIKANKLFDAWLFSQQKSKNGKN